MVPQPEKKKQAPFSPDLPASTNPLVPLDALDRLPANEDGPAPGEASTTRASTAEACPRCGTVDVPLLSPGTGPHAYQASCQHCFRHLRWVSLLAPAERQARRIKGRMQAMAKRPATAPQLAYLRALGYEGPAPGTMAEASALIDEVIRQRQKR